MDVSASDVGGGHSDFGVKEIQVKLRCSPGGGQTGFALFDRRERGSIKICKPFTCGKLPEARGSECLRWQSPDISLRFFQCLYQSCLTW